MASRPLFSFKSFLRALSSSPTAISDGGVRSTIYQQSMFRRPPTVKRRVTPGNSCSFIGTVVRPVERYAVDDPLSSAYTILEVKGPPTDQNPSSFWLFLQMSDKLAEVSLKYLNPNDLIHVHGPLTCFKRSSGNDCNKIFYKVIVKELNFITCHGRKSIEPESSIAEESTTPTSRDSENKCHDRLRLWQIFFASPYEWWDNRQKKLHPSLPDFKHKDTHECLWLRSDDPPWLRRQLQLFDSKMLIPSRHSKLQKFKIDYLN